MPCQIKNNCLITLMTLILYCTGLTICNAQTSEVSQLNMTVNMPLITDVTLSPSSNTFGIITITDFNLTTNDTAGHTITIGDGNIGGSSFIQTNSTNLTGYDHVRVDFTAVDGIDIINIVDNNPTFTLTIADAAALASVEIIISADSDNAIDPYMEDNNLNTTEFTFIDADTIQSNGVLFSNRGYSWLNMKLDLDESSIDFNDHPTSLDLRVTVTISES